METFRKLVSIVVGALLIVGAILDDCPRVAMAAVGLLLLGAVTVPDVISVVKGASLAKSEQEDE